MLDPPGAQVTSARDSFGQVAESGEPSGEKSPAALSFAEYADAAAAEPEPFTIPELLTAINGGDLMDLGAEAQAQGVALGLRAVRDRLASCQIDLMALGEPAISEEVSELRETIAERVEQIIETLEARGRARRGE